MRDDLKVFQPNTARDLEPVSIFCSYAHRDEHFREELYKHLTVMIRNGEIAEWYDRKIGAGEEWKNSIDRHLKTAQIILLLVSADFLASKYCYEVEMKQAMQRHEAGSACVIPIILRECVWSDAPFSKLQALPKDAKPVRAWRDRDEAYKDIVTGIREAARQLRTIVSPTPTESYAKPSRPPENLLAYRCDRKSQYESLTSAMRNHHDAKASRPLVCLVHGHNRECHTEFLGKISQEILPQLFGTLYDDEPEPSICKFYELLPSWEKYRVNDFESVLGKELSAKTQRPGSPYDQMVALRPARCVILNFVFQSEDWRHLKRVNMFLEYWARFPDMPRDMILAIFLNFRYRHRTKLSERWSNSWQNLRLRAHFKHLGNRAIANLSIAALEELLAVKEADAYELIDHPDVRDFYEFQPGDIERLYSNEKKCPAPGTMHMSDLIDDLLNIHSRRTSY